MRLRSEPPDGRVALVFMVKKTVFADTGAADLALEFIAVTDFMPAFATFDGAVNELKHSGSPDPSWRSAATYHGFDRADNEKSRRAAFSCGADRLGQFARCL